MGMSLPAVRLRAYTDADAAALRRWELAPEQFLRVEDLLACADMPGTVTRVALDADGDVVALLQSVPEGCESAGTRSVALLVHPGHRGAGVGRATLLAALDEPALRAASLRAVIDRENAASLRCFATCGFAADGDAPGQYVELARRVPAHRSSTPRHDRRTARRALGRAERLSPAGSSARRRHRRDPPRPRSARR